MDKIYRKDILIKLHIEVLDFCLIYGGSLKKDVFFLNRKVLFHNRKNKAFYE